MYYHFPTCFLLSLYRVCRHEFHGVVRQGAPLNLVYVIENAGGKPITCRKFKRNRVYILQVKYTYLGIMQRPEASYDNFTSCKMVHNHPLCILFRMPLGYGMYILSRGLTPGCVLKQ
jgi:hypothetical protein